jgi:chemotaxis protein methyltransferase CheR
LLTVHLQGAPMSTPLTRQDFGFIRDLLRRRSAIVLEAGKEYLAEFRLGAVAKREGFESLAALVAQLRANPHDRLSQTVVEAMTTNETSFFRDQHPFEALRQHILPRLIAHRSADRRLNIWCAASSSGQEPYSIAMVLRELGICAPRWNLRFLATDLSREMVTRGRQGCYSALEVNRGLPVAMRAKYFRSADGRFQANDELRNMIEFSELNLSEAWPAFPAIDLVFVRNVLIYFDTDSKKQILARIRRRMSPLGCLFLGSSETTITLDGDFHKHQHGKANWYQTSATAL